MLASKLFIDKYELNNDKYETLGIFLNKESAIFIVQKYIHYHIYFLHLQNLMEYRLKLNIN